MAIAFVQKKSVFSNVGSGNNYGGPTLDAGPTNGNLLLAFIWIHHASGGNFSSTGWTHLTSFTTTEPQSVGILYKVAGASEPTSHTFSSPTGGFTLFSIDVLELSGVDAATPIDVSPGSWTETFSGSAQTVPAISIATNGAWDVVAINQRDGGPGYSSSSGGYTEQVDSDGFGVYTKAMAPGSTGTRSVTPPGFQTLCHNSFALRPSGGAAAFMPDASTFVRQAINRAGTY